MMSHEQVSPKTIRRTTLWIAMTAAAYLLLWKSALHWTGKWPAPYWFAVGLGVLLSYGILTPKKVHLTWVIPFACLSIVVAWFFGLGIYQTWARTVILHDYRWYYHNDWPARVPTIALMGAFVFCLSIQRRRHQPLRLVASIVGFLVMFFGLLFFAEEVCSFSLPRAGTTSHGNYDIFGFRLGGYYLFVTVTSVLLAKLILPHPTETSKAESE